MNASDPRKSVQPAKRQSPLAVPVQVQCEGFRCLAYRDPEGKWIDYCSGKPLTGKVQLIEPPAD